MFPWMPVAMGSEGVNEWYGEFIGEFSRGLGVRLQNTEQTRKLPALMTDDAVLSAALMILTSICLPPPFPSEVRLNQYVSLTI